MKGNIKALVILFTIFLMAIPVTKAHAAIGDNLVGYWNLNETSGPRTDTGGANTLTEQGGTVGSSTGVIGNAALFNSTKYLSVDDSVALSMGDIDFTVAGWVNLTSKGTSGFQGVIGKYFNTAASSREYAISYSFAEDRFKFYVSPDGASNGTSVAASSLGSPSLNTWYYVVAWHDSVNNTINIQVNNGAIDSLSYSSGVFDGSAALQIGAYANANILKGKVDAAGIWKRVLTPTERTQLYNAGAGYEYTTALPSAPTNVVVAPDNGKAALMWSGSSGTPTDYIIEYKLSTDSSWTTFADGTSANVYATVTGLTNGLNYDFRISAVNGGGTGAVSSTVSTAPLSWSAVTTDNFTRADSPTIGNGWLDPNSATSIASNQLVFAPATVTPWVSKLLLRPTSENAVDQRLAITYLGTNTDQLYGSLRTQSPGNQYLVGIDSNHQLRLGVSINGTHTWFGSFIPITGYTSAHNYLMEGFTIGTSPTTLYGVVTDLTTGAIVAMKSVTDSSAVLQSAGQIGFNTSGTTNVLADDFASYARTAAAATSYTFTGPSTVTMPDTSTNFSVTPNGAYTGIITPSDNGAGGTFTPSSISYSNSSAKRTFTYTPASIGTKTISVSSSPALTDPSALSLTVTALNGAIPVNDTNLVWSPYNWRFNGSNWAQTEPGGAYVKVAFTGSTLSLGVDTSVDAGVTLSGIVVDAYIDGATVPIAKTLANVSGGLLNFTTSLSSGTHYAIIYLSKTTTSFDRWVIPVNVLRVTKIQLASDGTGAILPLDGTPLAKKDAKIIIFGDSITEGVHVSQAEKSYAADLGQSLGVEYGQIGFSSLGWSRQATGGVAYFSEAVAANSSWRNYDGTTSRLVDNNNLSSGFIGGAPDDIFINLGVNDADYGTGAPAVRTKMAAWLSDIRQVVGSNTRIFVISPFNFGNTGDSTMVTYKTALLGGVSDYLSGHTDNRLYTLDLGPSGYATVVANSTDSLHPDDTGSALLAAALLQQANVYLVNPTISSVAATGITTTAATITWTTDMAANSQVQYGDTTAYGSIVTDTALTTSHSMSLTGLQSGTTYHYRVISNDAGEITTSAGYTFTTGGNSGGGVSGGGGVPLTPAVADTSACRPGDLFSAVTGARCAGDTPSVTPPVSNVLLTANLKFGITSIEAKVLQQYLNAHGYTVAAAGAGSAGRETTYFGSATKAAVMKFQKAHGLIADGIVGPVTRSLINKE